MPLQPAVKLQWYDGKEPKAVSMVARMVSALDSFTENLQESAEMNSVHRLGHRGGISYVVLEPQRFSNPEQGSIFIGAHPSRLNRIAWRPTLPGVVPRSLGTSTFRNVEGLLELTHTKASEAETAPLDGVPRDNQHHTRRSPQNVESMYHRCNGGDRFSPLRFTSKEFGQSKARITRIAMEISQQAICQNLSDGRPTRRQLRVLNNHDSRLITTPSDMRLGRARFTHALTPRVPACELVVEPASGTLCIMFAASQG